MVNKKTVTTLCLVGWGLFFCVGLTNCASIGQAKVDTEEPLVRVIHQEGTKPEGSLPEGLLPEEPLRVETKNISMAQTLMSIEQPEEYILGSGDSIEISVLHHDELKQDIPISPTGKIMYHYLGDIQAGGLTIFQLRDKIQQGLAEFIKHPDVTLRITNYQSHKVFVVGQVDNPGVYRMQDNITLLEGLTLAGGANGDAYLKGAYVVREGKMLLVNFYELVKKGNMTENIFLQPDDVIFIPNKHDQKVYILGEVNKPTIAPLEDQLNLLQAITLAGGFTRDANPSTVFLMRGNLSKPQVVQIDVERILTEGNLMANIPLQQGDIIYVASSFWADVDRFFEHISVILDPIVKLERGIILGPLVEEVLTGDAGRRRVIVTE